MKTEIPEWLKSYVINLDTFYYNGVEYTYAVVQAKLGTDQGAPEIFTIMNQGVLAISDSYPEQWRELGLIHEIIENSSELNGLSCLQALQKELFLAQRRGCDMKEYKSYRLNFFQGLVGYYLKKNRSGDEDNLLNRLLISLENLKG